MFPNLSQWLIIIAPLVQTHISLYSTNFFYPLIYNDDNKIETIKSRAIMTKIIEQPKTTTRQKIEIEKKKLRILKKPTSAETIDFL